MFWLQLTLAPVRLARGRIAHGAVALQCCRVAGIRFALSCQLADNETSAPDADNVNPLRPHMNLIQRIKSIFMRSDKPEHLRRGELGERIA